jgi:type 1 glutamine amidotransferase
MNYLLRIVGVCALCLLLPLSQAAPKKLVLIAGKMSHGPGDHEFHAGCLLLKKCLDQVPGIAVSVHDQGWPKDETVFEGADALVIYSDGGGGHPALVADRLERIERWASQGMGVGMMHYAVEVPKDKAGPQFQRLIGGYYEHEFSCNPMWSPEFNFFPTHPITRGVKPFTARDEWYFNMRFLPGLKGVTPVLLAKPSDQVRKGPYVYPQGPYSHIIESSGRDEALLWAVERPGGGRGFGWTGGHYHQNWLNENYRKVVLNALLWVTKVDVPPQGVESCVSEADLAVNLDPKKK